MPLKLKEKTLDEMKKDAISNSVAERGYKKGGMVKKPTKASKTMKYAKGGMVHKMPKAC
jgi:hypothetical protein